MASEKPQLVLKNCKAFVEGKISECNIGISEGKIVAVKKILEGEQSIDCSHKLVLPGAIDIHVHFRVPGEEWKADWKHESMAALHGGITSVMDMPNNKPSICSAEVLELKRRVVSRKAGVDFSLHFGASPKHLEEIQKAKDFAAVKIYMGSSTGSLLVLEREDQAKAFSLAKAADSVVMVHAEEEKTIKESAEKARKKGWNHAKFHSQIRPPEAEHKAVKRALALCAETGAKLHVCHVSSAETLSQVMQAKKWGSVTCGVTPHHLFLSSEDAKKLGNLVKVNPPLHSRHNRAMLWEALREGKFDIIESDHAPHTQDEKQASYWDAPSGVPGVETMLPLLLDAHNRKLVSIETIAKCLCENPAKLFGLREKGFIAKGKSADLAVIDLKREHRIDSGKMFTKCGWTPFEGWRLKGFVEKTFLRGELRQEEGEII
ncbi:MAG: dihydroorotase [Candidatus Diapherotrites archaeon]